MMDDLISREYMKSLGATCIASRSKDGTLFPIVAIDELPTHPTPSNTLGALDCVERQFEEIVIEYPNITDEEHKGKPYYSIKYVENGKDKIIGFGTYKIEVLSRYIRDYFIQSVQSELSSNSQELDNKNGELISRQAAIDAVSGGMCSGWDCDVIDKLKALPSVSVQPTTLTEDDKETIRIHLSAFKESLCNQHRWNEAREYEELINRLLSTLFVIRCKECKHWAIGNTTKNYPNPYICELHSFMHGFERSALPEDYCSWAELKGEEAKEGGDKGC